MGKNKTVEEWCTVAKNITNGLYLVAIGNQRIPVSNQICPICKKGWNAPFLFAVKDNKVYHRICLELNNLYDESVIAEKA